MSDVPEDLRYSSDHEWVKEEAGGKLRIGVTDYAQDALGDVVYVGVPAVGTVVTAGASVGEVVLLDGVKVIDDDGWVLVLPDPEEPITHVWAEGSSDSDARRRAQEQVGKIRRLLG